MLETNTASSYAQATLTSRSCHLNEICSCVRYLMGQGNMPMKNFSKDDDNVVYADFNNKNVAVCQ